jgi:hypothetical protein
MIKSNLINQEDGSIALDLSVDGSKSKVISEYLTIVYQLLSNGILENDSIDMFNEIVKLAIIETNNDFETFVRGVVSSYYKNRKVGD